MDWIINILSIAAIYLTQQPKEELKKYASIPGLISQPFWLLVTYQAEQWGLFTLSVVYTYIWYMGFKSNFID